MPSLKSLLSEFGKRSAAQCMPVSTWIGVNFTPGRYTAPADGVFIVEATSASGSSTAQIIGGGASVNNPGYSCAWKVCRKGETVDFAGSGGEWCRAIFYPYKFTQ